MERRSFFGIVTAAMVALFLPSAADAGNLPSPSGKVILTVTGNIEGSNVGDEAQFDRELLEAIGTHTFVTSTPYTEGQSTWRGVLLSDLLAYAGANGNELVMTAIDLYELETTREFVDGHNILLAFEKDGKRLRVRDKGPVWAIFDWDSDPSLDNDDVKAHSVWQLKTIRIK